MKRWHEDFKISRREWKKHRDRHVKWNKSNCASRVGRSPYEVDCICDEQIGRFRKMDAFDCGRPRCGLCHSSKRYNLKTEKEIAADFIFREQLLMFLQSC